MEHLSPPQRFFLDVTRYLFAVAFYTRYKRLLGLRLSSWIYLGPLTVAVVALVRDWGGGTILAALLLFLLIWATYWWIGRQGYKKFIPDPTEPVPRDGPPIPDNQRIVLNATGTFAVNEREEYLLDRAPSQYWRVPLGEHIIMVEQAPGKYLYQFFRAETLADIEPGYLIVGARTQKALAITFWVTWGPGYQDETVAYYVAGGQKPPERFKRTIYFTFENSESRRAVWHTIWQDLIANRENAERDGQR